MVEIGARLQRVTEEIMGNESLLEMLETDAATELLDWGLETASELVEETKGMDEAAAEQLLVPRLKAVRQTMRLVGNWAAGKYVEPASRVQLRDSLLGHFKVIFGGAAHLPSAEEMDELLSQVDDHNKTPHELIKKLKRLLEESS